MNRLSAGRRGQDTSAPWLVNWLCWAYVVHAFMWWNARGLLPPRLLAPSLSQRYGTTWAGIAVHGFGDAIWLVVLPVGVALA